jgi:hypothetical protein
MRPRIRALETPGAIAASSPPGARARTGTRRRRHGTPRVPGRSCSSPVTPPGETRRVPGKTPRSPAMRSAPRRSSGPGCQQGVLPHVIAADVAKCPRGAYKISIIRAKENDHGSRSAECDEGIHREAGRWPDGAEEGCHAGRQQPGGVPPDQRREARHGPEHPGTALVAGFVPRPGTQSALRAIRGPTTPRLPGALGGTGERALDPDQIRDPFERTPPNRMPMRPLGSGRMRGR